MIRSVQYGNKNNMEYNTPPLQKSLSSELKQVLMQRNLLTAKSRTKMCNMLDIIDQEADDPSINVSFIGATADDGINRSAALTSVSNSEKTKLISLRSQAIDEILNTEKSYLMHLEKLINYFVLPLKDNHIINLTVHNTLFGQIELIYNLNKELLTELEANPLGIADSFLRIAPFLKLYSVYAFDYNEALVTLQNLTQRNVEFHKFLERTESLPIIQTKLNSLLITPIQRVPRYRLLLQQVLLYTSPCESNYKILQRAIKEIENTVSHINDVVEDQETKQKMINLQNSLINGIPHIIRPGRKIIKEGIINKMSSNGQTLKRYCILMSDIFMYCKILKDRQQLAHTANSLQCCCIFPLKKCKVSEIFPGNFKITCQGDGIILCSDNVIVSRNWITSIREAIEIHIQCRKTIRKGSSKRKPIRHHKDLNNFEINDLLSPQRKKYANSESESDTSYACCNIRPTKALKRKLPSVGTLTYDNRISDDDDEANVNNIGDDKIIEIVKRKRSLSSNDENVIDETYGFAEYLNKRTNVLNSSETNQSKFTNNKQQHQNNNNDILFPLRANNNNNDNNNNNNNNNIENNRNAETYQSSMSNKKHVTFNSKTEYFGGNENSMFSGYSGYAHSKLNNKTCTNHAPNELTLKDKIVNFFSSLF